jgi:hypothetical protein
MKPGNIEDQAKKTVPLCLCVKFDLHTEAQRHGLGRLHVQIRN